MSKEKQYFFELESKPFEIDNLSKYLKQAFEGFDISDDYYNQWLLILTEAVNNAIIHGNKRNANKKVYLDFYMNDDEFKVVITDEGEGFDEVKVPDPTLPENIFREHGRGLYIMRHFTNKMYYEKSKRGNSLVLISKIKKQG